MFVLVQLLEGFNKPLLYQIPLSWAIKPHVGSLVTVPLRRSLVPALVTAVYHDKPEHALFTIKAAHAYHEFPQDHCFHPFIESIASFYSLQVYPFYQRLKTMLATEEINEETQYTHSLTQTTTKKSIYLTDEQKKAVDSIIDRINNHITTPLLLHGVTGSGKTEIYKQALLHCLSLNLSVILLLPEVSLSVQFQRLLSLQLPSHTPLFGFHSATKKNEKRKLWEFLQQKKACVIIGVHMPIFLPIPNLGLVIIDEEHEDGFVEKKHPKINSKQAALIRAQLYKVPIILGSATPALTSLHNVTLKKWETIHLTQRFQGSFPEIQQVILSKQGKRPFFWISVELQAAMRDRLAKKEQTIIYLNRRGHSFFVQCSSCGFTFMCPNCSVSLTLHTSIDPIDRSNGIRTTHDGKEHTPTEEHTLLCHYCSHQQINPSACSQCKAPEKGLIKKGIGTQQIAAALQKLFPQAVIARADLDTTKKKQQWHDTIDRLQRGEIDILVGTQLITKGYHFPRVSLVGIIWADLNLHFPVFDAAETTLQKLIQVAGRSGRSLLKSRVIVQSLADYPILKYISEETYPLFCTEELEFRRQAGYPPFKRLTYIELKHTKEEVVDSDANVITEQLRVLSGKHQIPVTILGPSKPMVHRIQKTESRIILLKSDTFHQAAAVTKNLSTEGIKSSLFITPHQ